MFFFIKNIKEKFINIKKTIDSFIDDIRKKLQNLYKTNYETGLYHLNNGNLFEALFRFKILSKFWPDFLDGRYYLAYVLLLRGCLSDSKEELKKIIKKDSNYVKATELLKSIDAVGYRKIIEEYYNKINESIEKKNKENI